LLNWLSLLLVCWRVVESVAVVVAAAGCCLLVYSLLLVYAGISLTRIMPAYTLATLLAF
jgi:hypothetical protein